MPYTTEDKIKTAERLADLRKELGLSYMQLSDEIRKKEGVSISHTSLKDYEETDSVAHPTAFKKNMNISNLVVLAEFYNVSFDYLLGKSDSKIREHVDINTELGLSDDAIETLKSIKRQPKEDIQYNAKLEKSGASFTNVINAFLEEKNYIMQFLDDFCWGIYNAYEYKKIGGDKKVLVDPKNIENFIAKEVEPYRKKGLAIVTLKNLSLTNLNSAEKWLTLIFHTLESRFLDDYPDTKDDLIFSHKFEMNWMGELANGDNSKAEK